MAHISVSLGSNINADFHLRTAIFLLRPYFSDLLISPVYESKPVNFGGNNFYNIVFGGKVKLSLERTVELLKSIEKQYNRDRSLHNNCEITLDLDLLFYDDLIIQQPIELPRKEILNNAFVLQPLSDIYPELNHPTENLTYAQLWHSFNKASQKLWPITFNWNKK